MREARQRTIPEPTAEAQAKKRAAHTASNAQQMKIYSAQVAEAKGMVDNLPSVMQETNKIAPKINWYMVEDSQ